MAVDLTKLERLYNNAPSATYQPESTKATGNIDMDKLTRLYNNAPSPAITTRGQKNSVPVVASESATPTTADAVQQQNYDRMQGLFNRTRESDAADLARVNNEILAISGYGAGADRSKLQSLLQQKDQLEQRLKTGRYDEDLTALERVQLTAQGIGESLNYTPDVLIDTATQAYRDRQANKGNADYLQLREQQKNTDAQIALLERRAMQGVLDNAGFAQLAQLRNLKKQQESDAQRYRTPLDINSDSVQGMRRAMQAQQQATYGMGDAAAFLYNTGASIAENASLMPLAMLPGGQTAILAIMGAKSAAQKAVEVGESGGTAAEALVRGLSSGLIESATEKLPLDNLVKIAKGSTGKAIIKNILKQAGEEGTEEAVSYIANSLVDMAAMDPNAKFSIAELLMAFGGGALSGGVMGTGAEVIGRRKAGADINDGSKTVENKIDSTESEINSTESEINSTESEINSTENAVLQPNAKDEEKEALIKKVQEMAGVDTRTETEKVTEEQQSKVAAMEDLVSRKIAPQEHLDRVRQSAEETIAETRAKQENIDYQKQDVESGAVRQQMLNEGREKAVDRVEQFAAKRGLKIKYFDADVKAEGAGFIKGDTMYLNARAGDKILQKTAIHETIHGLRNNNQEEFNNLYNTIVDYAEQYKGLHDVVNKTIKAYTNPKSVAYTTMLKDDGSGEIDQNKLNEEVLAKLCEEVIDDPESFIDKVNGDKTVLSAVADILRRIKNNIAIALTNSEKAKLDNAVMAIEDYLKGNSKFTVEETNADGDAVTIKDKESNRVMYNLWQYNNGGKKVLMDTLEKQKFSAKDIKRAADIMTEMAEMMENFAKKYASVLDWNNTEVLYDQNGRTYYSAMVKNGDYKINIDLSTICKKRIALQNILNRLVKQNLIGDVSLSPENIATINKILKDNGYETQCPACFVESKRYNIEKWANDFADKWNSVLEEAGFTANGTFDFSHGETSGHMDTMAMLTDDLSKADEMLANIGTQKRDENGNILYNKKGKPQMYKPNTKQKIVMLLKENPQLRKRFTAQDLIGTEGIKNIKTQYPEIYSLILTQWGVATPKIVQTTIPYNNEVAVYKNIAKKSKYIGGVRMFSFSDFTIDQVFDYVQIVADLYAQKAMMHTYTKEIAFAKLFGTTGIKINLSFIPAIDKSAGRENAGLNANGELIYSEWGVNPEEAKALMKDSRYSPNLTPIMIGVSDNHIWKLLDTEDIRYIIPYHKSSLNPVVAKMTDIEFYKDYSDYQTTRHADGSALTKAENNKFDFYKTLEKTKDARKAADKYLEWCKENGYIPKFDDFAEHPNYYKLLVDFNLYDAVTGEFVPQKPVTMNFPEEFNKIVGEELAKQKGLNDELSKKDDKVFAKIVKEISNKKHSIDIENESVEDDDFAGLSIREKIAAVAESKGSDSRSFNEQRKAENLFIKQLSGIFGIPTATNVTNERILAAKSELKNFVKDITKEIKSTGMISEETLDGLIDKAFEYGVMDIGGRDVSLEDYYGEYSDAVKSEMRKIIVDYIEVFEDRINEIANYEAALLDREQKRKEMLEKGPISLEEFYAAHQKTYLAEKKLRAVENNALLTEDEKKLVNALMAGVDKKTITGPRKNKIIAVYEAKKAVNEARAPITQYRAALRNNRESVADRALVTFRGWNDKGGQGLRYDAETFERNIRDVVPDKDEAKFIIDTYVKPVHKAEAAATRMKNDLRQKIKDLGIDTGNKKLYKIVYGMEYKNSAEIEVNESGLVQLLGEGLIDEARIKSVGADFEKIKNATNVFKEIYADLYKQTNEALLRNGYAPMGKIENYFPHFIEEADTMLSKIAKRAGFEITTNKLPTDIAGITDTFRPGKKFFGHTLSRNTDTTVYDAIKGFDQYIEGAAAVIYQTDNIQNIRTLENRLRFNAGDAGLKKALLEIDMDNTKTETEKQDAKDKLYEETKNSNLSGFVSYLRRYGDNLAGKKHRGDRGIEDDIGRGVYTLSKALESRIASNMIGGNIGSALTNIIPITQATAEIKTKYLLKAMNETMGAMREKDSSFEIDSDFLVNRIGSEKIFLTNAQKASQIAGAAMQAIDRFASNVIVRAKYQQNVEEYQMTPEDAMDDANSYAAELLADRSKGALPLFFERKNPIVKAVTMFQVEQNNQLRYLIKDLPKNLKEEGKNALIFALLKYAVAAWLYNLLYKKIAGRKPAFDPIDIGYGITKDTISTVKGEMKTSAALTNAVTAVAEEIPFISGLVGGGRVPISSALPDAAETIKLADRDVSAEKKKSIVKKELTKPLWYLALPTGGGQLKKIADTAELYGKNKGVQYSIQSDGSKKVQFANDPSVGAVAQSAAFGKWASKPAQEYINSGFKGLSKNQTEAFEGLKDTGLKNSEAVAMVKGISEADTDNNGYYKTEEAKSWLDRQVLTRKQKAILFRCMCPNVKNNPYE